MSMDNFTKEQLWGIAKYQTRDKELINLTLGYIAQGFRLHQVRIRCDAACTNAIEMRLASDSHDLMEAMIALHSVARGQGWIIKLPEVEELQLAHCFSNATHYCAEHCHLAHSTEEE